MKVNLNKKDLVITGKGLSILLGRLNSKMQWLSEDTQDFKTANEKWNEIVMVADKLKEKR